MAARASCCRTPLQAFDRASQAERPNRSPASASRCSCPSPERKRSRRAAKLACPTCDCGPQQQLVDPLDARVGSLHPRDERSSHFEFGWSRRMAPIVAATPWSEPGHELLAQFRVRALHTNNQSTPVRGLRKGSQFFAPFLKAMVGFTLLSRSYYYLRRRSPGAPFPPDHRRAGERGAIRYHTGRVDIAGSCDIIHREINHSHENGDITEQTVCACAYACAVATWHGGGAKDSGLRKLLTLLRILMAWCALK